LSLTAVLVQLCRLRIRALILPAYRLFEKLEENDFPFAENPIGPSLSDLVINIILEVIEKVNKRELIRFYNLVKDGDSREIPKKRRGEFPIAL
jgi:hypothetical protein